MSGLTGFVTGGQDLSAIFQKYTSGTKANTTNFISNGQDLKDIFQKAI